MREPAAVFHDPAIIEFLRISTIEKDTSVYMEIYRRLRRLIKDGILKPGDSLPSESALAAILCVGRTSLRTALSILYEDGYIETTRGKGSYVTGDSRKEKYRRNFPSDILLPPERIRLLGDLTVKQSFYDPVRGDDFLAEKLFPAPGREIMQLQQLYCLNGKPAILSFYYFVDDRFPTSIDQDPEEVYEKLAQVLHRDAVTAEYECVPMRIANPSGLHPSLSKGIQQLVTTQYIDSRGIMVFGKDYYNSEVMRFRFAIRK